MEYILYQTLQDRNNYIECESEGPFSCNWENTWLGNGYYFWFHHIELAKWWGKARYNSDSKFVIFKSVCKNTAKCWDLHANPYHQEEFFKWLKVLKIKGLFSENTTVLSVIEFIKNECKEFDYEGIRVLGVDSLSAISAEKSHMPRLKFEIPEDNSNKIKQRFLSYLDVFPPVQVCLFHKDALERDGFEVVFPDEYKKDNRSFENIYI